ncbi:MAG: hypothetical protein U1F66_07300 [bacterium]
MGTARSEKVIPLRSRGARRQKGGAGAAAHLHELEAYDYTLDLLMEDFGKKHQKENCVLCEPMKTVGLHRDAVMVDLAETLFLAFFPSFEGYVLEVRDGLMQGLLDRRERGPYESWQDKLKDLLRRQVLNDLGDFLTDIQKHLLKFAGVELEAERREAVLAEAMARLERDWLWKAR